MIKCGTNTMPASALLETTNFAAVELISRLATLAVLLAVHIAARAALTCRLNPVLAGACVGQALDHQSTGRIFDSAGTVASCTTAAQLLPIFRALLSLGSCSELTSAGVGCAMTVCSLGIAGQTT